MNDQTGDKIELVELPSGYHGARPNTDDLLLNLHRIMSYFGVNEPTAANTIWWSEQIIRGEQNTGTTEATHRQDQLRAVAVAKVRQMIMRHIPYPPFRDEALAALDEMLKVFGYFK